MATENSSSFRFWRPGINFRAKFETPSEIGELDNLLKDIQLGQQQQHVLRSSPSWRSASIHSNESSGGHALRVPEIIRRKSHRLRQSWTSSNEPSSDQQSQQMSSLQSLEGAAAISPPSTVPAASGSVPDERRSHPRGCGDHFQSQHTATLVRSPAKPKTRQQAKEARRRKKQDEKTRKEAEDDRRNDLRRRITEAREGRRLQRNSSDDAENSKQHAESFLPITTSPSKWRRSLLMLSPHSRRSKGTIPMPQDFSSKAELQAYLNPIEHTASIPQIPELPADPPPYKTPDSETKTSTQPVLKTHSAAHESFHASHMLAKELFSVHAKPEAKRMKCDGCKSPIRVSEKYYHCLICNGGDQIMCVACSYNGDLCRHELSWKINSVKGAPIKAVESNSEPQQSECLQSFPLKSRVVSPLGVMPLVMDNHQTKATAEALRESEYGHAKATIDGFEAFQRAESMYRHNQTRSKADHSLYIDDLHRRHNHVRKLERNLGQRDEEAKQRERDLSLREKEASLRDREATLREQYAALREREATMFERTTLQRVKTMSSSAEAAISQDRSDLDLDPRSHQALWNAAVRNTTHVAFAEIHNETADVLEGCDCLGEGSLDQLPTISRNGIREHAGTKRKASAANSYRKSTSSSKSPQVNGKALSQGSPSNGEGSGDDGGEESNDDNNLKRRKQVSQSSMSQRLLACPYSKFDPARYSERNQHEKQYRGCSGRYLTDISRLKQHLYRVHRRPEHHCARCFGVFQSKDELDYHSRRAESCPLSECSFAEKFTEDRMKELKRKRPGKSAEQSWYIIFEILFPDQVPPDSPYIDDQPAQSTSTAATSGPSDAQTSNLLDIFNEQLSQRQHIANYAWLASQEARDLINQTLAQSMAEMLRRMSPNNTPSVGRTPSIFISPTSVSAQPGSTLQTPASSLPASPVSPKRPSSNMGTVRELSPLQALQVDLNNKLRDDRISKRAEICNSDAESSLHTGTPQFQPTTAERDTNPLPDGVELSNLEDVRDDPDYGMRFDHELNNDTALGAFDFDLPPPPATYDSVELHRSGYRTANTASRKEVDMTAYVNDEDLDYVQSSMMAGAAATNHGAGDEKMNSHSKRSVDSGYESKPTSRQNSQREQYAQGDDSGGHEVVTNIGLAFGGQHPFPDGATVHNGLGLGFLDGEMVHGATGSGAGVSDGFNTNSGLRYWWSGGSAHLHQSSRNGVYRGGVGGRF